MVIGSLLPIVLVTLCLLLFGDVVSGLRDGGRHIRRITVADLPPTSTTPPRNASKTVASVVAEDILQSGGGISAPGNTNASSLPTAPSYDSYLFGDQDGASDFDRQVQENNGKRVRDKDTVRDVSDYSATLTTPRMNLFDEHHSRVSESIRQRLEELEERFHSSTGPNFETSPSSVSYPGLGLDPESHGNGTLELDYSNRFSLVFNETYDPPQNIHREIVIQNGTKLDMESTVLVHNEYQEIEPNSNTSSRSPTIVAADVKKKKKIIVLPEATTAVNEGDSNTQESQSTGLPEETNIHNSTVPPGNINSTTPHPVTSGRSISQRFSSDATTSTTTKEMLDTSSQISSRDSEARMSENNTIVSNLPSSEAEHNSEKDSSKNHNATERFMSLLHSTTERSARQLTTEGVRGGRMLVNENSTNSLGSEVSLTAPSPVASSADQADKLGVRAKTTLRRLNRTEWESTTERFTSPLRSTAEPMTTTPSATTEWRSRSRSYPQRRPFAAASVTTSSFKEEPTTIRPSRRTTPRRRLPTITITDTTENNTIVAPRPTWRRQSAAENGTDNSEGNDLKPNRGRGSVRYGSSEANIPATATAWTLVSLRSPPVTNSTRLVRQPENEKATTSRGRRPASSTTQSSMQENRVSMVHVLAPLLAGEELANLSQNNSSNTSSPSEYATSTTEPASSEAITTIDQSSTLTTIANDITTFVSDIFTTLMPNKEESVATETPPNKSIQSTEKITAKYDSTTIDMNENNAATEVTTILSTDTAMFQSGIPDNSLEPENVSLTNNEAATITFLPDIDYFVENTTNIATKFSNPEKQFDDTTKHFNTSTAEESIDNSHSYKMVVNSTTEYSDETTTVESTTNNSENVTVVNITVKHTENTTASPESTTVYPQIHNITSEFNNTIAQYSTNATTDEAVTTIAAHVTKLVNADDDLVSVTPLEAEEEEDTIISLNLMPSTTGTPSTEFVEDVHVFTQREDPEEESFDQTTTTSSLPDLTAAQQTTPLFEEKEVTKETTTEATASSSISEMDWEQPTTIQPAAWDAAISVYLHVVMESSWEVFCTMIPSFRTSITEKFKECTQKSILPMQVVIDESSCNKRKEDIEQIEVSMYLINEKGEHDTLLTTTFGSCFGSDNQLSGFVVDRVEVMPLHEEESGVGGWGVIAAIAITCVGAVCLLIFLILMVILRKRQKKLNYGQRCTPVSLDAYSLDSVSICGSTRRKGGIRASKRSYGNAGFDDPGSPSHPMGFAGLANFVMNRASIDEEFTKIPQVSASVDELPEGVETRNRYANVIPLPETRVALNLVNGDTLSHYINANFVRGPKEERKFYIACQAPLPTTVTDFWRMIWEQQSRAILMLTELVENGVEKCADYLPPSEVLDCHRLFGDFQVTLKKREVKEKYIISTLQLKNLETNSWREVTHLWYLGWPTQGVPAEEDTPSVITFLLEARPHMRGGPTVVHCSPGTGRTGTIIACDLCIRDFETTRIVDVPRTVARIRRDRAGAVQTRDQYAFIYQVINLYGMKLTGGALDSI